MSDNKNRDSVGAATAAAEENNVNVSGTDAAAAGDGNNNTPAMTAGEPAAGGNDGEKAGANERLFTADEVNEIVKKRLARVKGGVTEEQIAELADKAIGERAAELDKRESRLKCRELVHSEGYPEEFLEVLDTSDYDAFTLAADRLDIAMRSKYEKHDDPITRAMMQAQPHKPKPFER